MRFQAQLLPSLNRLNQKSSKSNVRYSEFKYIKTVSAHTFPNYFVLNVKWFQARYSVLKQYKDNNERQCSY
jgi:hypothetical protein